MFAEKFTDNQILFRLHEGGGMNLLHTHIQIVAQLPKQQKVGTQMKILPASNPTQVELEIKERSSITTVQLGVGGLSQNATG